MADESVPPQYLTRREVANRLRISVDTLKRYHIAGKLNGILWVDFFNDGKLRAESESVEAFIRLKVEATKSIYSRRLKKSRTS